MRYARGGVEYDMTNAELDDEPPKPYPYLLRKLLLFGGTNPGPHQVNRP